MGQARHGSHRTPDHTPDARDPAGPARILPKTAASDTRNTRAVHSDPFHGANDSKTGRAFYCQEARDCLAKEGFIVLSQFVPAWLTTQLRNMTHAHMRNILGGFDDPFKRVVDGEDFGCLVPESRTRMDCLPGKVWTKSSGREPEAFHPCAWTQKWGYSKTMGYNASSGAGQVFRGDKDFMDNEWLYY